MPTLEPQFEGLITQGSEIFSLTLVVILSLSLFHCLLEKLRYFGTLRPWNKKSSLDFSLSMASALAKIPEPVYGTPAISKKPCTVPSSPYVPCMAMKTTSAPLSVFNLSIALPVSSATKLFSSLFSSPLRNFLSGGCKSHFPSLFMVTGVRLYLVLSSAFKMYIPVARDTSRSEEGPPMRTTTFRFPLFIKRICTARIFPKRGCGGIPPPNPLLPPRPSRAGRNFSQKGFGLFSEYPTRLSLLPA